MALNQTQRDHAIKMIEAAIAQKIQSLKPIQALSERDFIEAHIKTKKIKSLSIAEIRNGISSNRWTGYEFSLLRAFGLEEAFDAHKQDVKETNEIASAGLRALFEQLKGEVMFGNDYSIVAAALEAISNYK